MRYALLINETPGSYDGVDHEDRVSITAEYLALRADPRVLEGNRLVSAESATTVRMTGDEVWLTDGPFADTKEVFGGYYVVEAANLDEALDLARRIPALRMGGSVEIRAVQYT